MGIFGLGGPEIAVIAGVAVLIFGKASEYHRDTETPACRLCRHDQVMLLQAQAKFQDLGKRLARPLRAFRRQPRYVQSSFPASGRTGM